MARATGATTASALPDDLLRDIFSRVPDPVDLLRCAGTCRRWLGLIGDPAFLRRTGGLLPETGRRASFLVGAFCQEAALASALKPMKKESTWPPQFLRLHAPPAGGGRPSFLPNDDGLLNYAKPLASRHGLLLVRIMPTPLDRQKLHLAVSHPLIGERSTRLVPPPPVDLDPKLFGDDITCYALVTAADHGTAAGQLDKHGQPAFQVLLTAVQSDDQSVYAYSYSSATDGWSAPIKCLQASGLTMSGPRAGTVTHGVVHWLYRDKTNFYTLGISADSPAHTASLTRIGIQIQVECDHLPMLQPPFPCIVGGTLSFVHRRNTGMLELWTKREQDDHGGGWLCSELMFEETNEITIIAFVESRGVMLVQNGNHLVTVDLESKEVEPVTGDGSIGSYTRELCGWVRCQGRNSCGDCTYNKLVTYEMNWPSYILHLCSGRLEAH
ncbi:unnamed protein product [Alopecurus aequalis]